MCARESFSFQIFQNLFQESPLLCISFYLLNLSYKHTAHFLRSCLCHEGAESWSNCGWQEFPNCTGQSSHGRMAQTQRSTQWQLHLSAHHLPSSWKRAAVSCSTSAGILSHWHSALQRSSSASRRYRDSERRADIPPSSRGPSDTRGPTAHWHRERGGENRACALHTVSQVRRATTEHAHWDTSITGRSLLNSSALDNSSSYS